MISPEKDEMCRYNDCFFIIAGNLSIMNTVQFYNVSQTHLSDYVGSTLSVKPT